MSRTDPRSKDNLHVLLDGHMLGEQEGGNETYVAGLVEGFGHLELSKSHKMTVLCGPRYDSSIRQAHNLHFKRLGNVSNLKRIFRIMSKLCQELDPDLVHVTYNASPFLTCPIIVTVHDVIHRLYPQYFSPRVRLLLSTLLPLTMMKAKAIVTVSQTSKEDIESFYPFTRGKIHVTPEAPGPIVNIRPNYEACKKHTLDQSFILSVGTVQPRKNIARLIQAYIKARAQGSTTARLLIVGRAAWQHSNIYQIARQSGYSKDIVFTGYLPDDTLAALYHRCEVFVYPSLYEGFGLPVLEAMACGAPVITSNCSSLPEVAGDAAVLVDPHSVEEIRIAVGQVVNNQELRQSLCQKGKHRAESFTWAKTAALTLAVYEQSVLMD